MAANTFGVGFTIRATDLASGVLRRVSGGFARMGNSARASAGIIAAAVASMGVGIAALSTGLAGLKGAFAAAVTAGEFAQNVGFLGVVTSRTGDALEELRTRALEASLATQFSPNEAILGLKRLATGGLEASEAMGALDQSLQLATFTGISVESASVAMITGLNAFRSEALTSAQVADKFANILANTNFQAADFERGFAVAAGTMSGFGQTMDTTLVSLGLMRNAGFAASRAATRIREATTRMTGSQSVINRLTKLGINIFKENGTTLKQMPHLIFEVEQALKKLSPEQAQVNKLAIFGKRGVGAYNVITQAQIKIIKDGVPTILKGADAFEHLIKRQAEVGTSKAFQDAILNTFEGQRKLLRGVLQGLVTEVGEGFGRFLKPIVGVLKETLAAVVGVVNKLPQSLKIMAGGLFIAASLVLVFAGAISILSGIFIIAIPFMGIVLVMVAAMSAAFLAAAQFGAGLVGVMLLFATKFTSKFGTVAEFMENTARKAKLLAETLRQMFTLGGIKLDLLPELMAEQNAGVLGLAKRIFYW